MSPIFHARAIPDAPGETPADGWLFRSHCERGLTCTRASTSATNAKEVPADMTRMKMRRLRELEVLLMALRDRCTRQHDRRKAAVQTLRMPSSKRPWAPARVNTSAQRDRSVYREAEMGESS